MRISPGFFFFFSILKKDKFLSTEVATLLVIILELLRGTLQKKNPPEKETNQWRAEGRNGRPQGNQVLLTLFEFLDLAIPELPELKTWVQSYPGSSSYWLWHVA